MRFIIKTTTLDEHGREIVNYNYSFIHLWLNIILSAIGSTIVILALSTALQEPPIDAFPMITRPMLVNAFLPDVWKIWGVVFSVFFLSCRANEIIKKELEKKNRQPES